MPKEQIDAVPPPASSASTLWAVLHKNAILKRRAWKTSICEIASPAIFLSVLVLGYALSDVTYIPSGVYASTTLRLDPLVRAAGPILSDAGLISDTAAACASGGVSGSSAECTRPELNLMSLRGSVNALLNGPLPVLPIDVYLAIGLGVRDSLGAANYRMLNEYDRYLQLFGNILTPGTLHLCPDSPPVRHFVNRSYARHPILQNITVRVHPSESEALDAVLNPADPGERSWAVIAFANLSATHVDYAIRLNYSTVPNTNRITRWIARGLDTQFQRYTTSGFLTLQALVDEYAFEMAAEEGAAVPYTPPSTYAFGTPMPTADFRQNLFYQAVSFMLSLVLTMCQLFPVSLLTKVRAAHKPRDRCCHRVLAATLPLFSTLPLALSLTHPRARVHGAALRRLWLRRSFGFGRLCVSWACAIAYSTARGGSPPSYNSSSSPSSARSSSRSSSCTRPVG